MKYHFHKWKMDLVVATKDLKAKIVHGLPWELADFVPKMGRGVDRLQVVAKL